MRRRIAVATAFAAAALAAPAQAANVSVHDGVATYSAGATNDNNLEIKPHPNGVVFEEETVEIHAGAGCSSINVSTVQCSSAGFTSIRAVMGVGDNTVLVTADFPTVIDGGGGDENRFWGGARTDVLIGGDKVDQLSGGSGSDDLYGGDGDDRLTGGPGDDELYGGGQGDRMFGEGGADRFDGDTGHDVVDYTGRATRVVASIDNLANDGVPVLGGEGDDIRSTVEVVIGGGGNDELTGSADSETLSGGPGDDVVRGLGGPDWLLGDEGIDTASYSERSAPVRVDLDGLVGGDGEQGENDSIWDTENVDGGGGDDTLTGDGAANALRGGAGDDSIDGGAGEDHLTGGFGDDTLRSEDGASDVDDCGDGTDTALADGLDAKDACELPVAEKPAEQPPVEQPPTEQPPVEQPPLEQPPASPLLTIGSKKVRVDRRGYVTLKLRCAAAPCSGRLTLLRGSRAYGGRSYSLGAGAGLRVKVKVARALRKRLGRKGLKVSTVAGEARRTIRLLPARR